MSMRIGVDGAALALDLQAGIANVTAQLLAEMARQRPEDRFTLLFPSRDFVAPEGVFPGPNVDWYATRFIDSPDPARLGQSLPTTDDPAPYLVVDDVRRVAPANRSSTAFTFVLDRPCRSMVLASRAARPCQIAANSGDERRLGIGIRCLHFRGPLGSVSIEHNDARLSAGFHGGEGDYRWTDGAAVLPRALFAGLGTPLTITVDLAMQLPRYFQADDVFVDEARSFYSALGELSARLEDICAARVTRAFDVFHSHHFAPRIVPSAINIATAYDIIPVLHPEYFGGDAVAHFRDVLDVFRRCERVFCISEATRRDLIARLDFHPDRLVYAPIDCDAAFRVIEPREASTEVLERYGLAKQPYIVCVGTIEPRKGHLAVIEAFNRLRAQEPGIQPRLALIGRRGWGFEAVFAAIEESPVRMDILYLDYVPRADLVHLYNGAHFAAYLSTYEGFGLPVLEALACGIPVVTSNVSSMPEVAGPAGLLVPPDDPEQIALAFQRMFTEPGMRERLAAAAAQQRARFGWTRTVQIYLEHIDDLVRRKARAA
jgi:glycosyltransferase involved in cell wall biosynthesis